MPQPLLSLSEFTYYIKGNHTCVLLFDTLLAYVRISFLCMAEYSIVYMYHMYMYHILFLHLSIGIGHWSCFCFVAIGNSFSVNIGVQIAESRPPVLLFIQPEVEHAFGFTLHGWQSDVYSARECTASWRRSWRHVSLSVCRARRCEPAVPSRDA